jgi:uncharacterized protein DUF1592/uncharacterized protein DUF1588/uncharacterized protein DUF1595/uncharacterized protein DUF1587/uncharacterized protein DUF1585
MKPGNESMVPTSSLRGLLACGVVAAFGAMACNGAISGEGMMPTGGQMTGGGAGSTSSTGAGATTPVQTGPGAGGAGGTGSAAGDPGRISIHRLNNLEYDNTMMDLVGVPGMAEATFQSDETGEFNNDADAFTMNDARYAQYFDAADTIGETIFSTPALKAQIMTCAPTAATDTCTSTIINAFGQRAWRRPLTPTEVQGLVMLAQQATALSPPETAENAVKQVVKTMLASPQFLYRIEFDTNPASLTPHALTPYELASRLSYLMFSSMPDATLFGLAGSGQIQTDANLSMQIDRMLADPKGANFTNSFAGQWLGASTVAAHNVEPTAFPTYTPALGAAMATESLMYFDDFLTGSLPFTQFYTAQENFVNTTLAAHYGFGTPTGTSFQKVMNGSPARVGFMGQGSFLTISSYSYRTAPTLRGRWILLNLLCQVIPPPPPGVPTLDPTTASASDPSLQQENVRARLEMHRQAATCAACHATLDPIGLGLENFDAIGKYRTSYAPGGPTIDASGMLPTGETFQSLPQLAQIMASGKQLSESTDCASHKMMTYALSRALGSTDDPYLNQVRTTWATQGWGLKPLLKDIVLNDTFRFRRGETATSTTTSSM